MGEDSRARRWDTDAIGHGMADGMAFAPGVERLLAALQLPDWVAEDPDTHLLPHLRAGCSTAEAPWRLVDASLVDAVYDVMLEWRRQDGNMARLRADIFELVGVIAEGTTYVQQQVSHDRITYAVITGQLDGDTPFRGHGYLVRFQVVGEAARRLLAGMHGPAGPSTTTGFTNS